MKFHTMVKYFIKYIVDSIYSKRLLYIRKDDYLLTEEKFQHIKHCAEKAYGISELDLHDCDSMADFLDQLGTQLGKVYVLTGDTWYVVAIQEISIVVVEDFASSTGRCMEIMSVYRTLFDLFKGKRIFMKCRETTSYPLVKIFERKGTYSIESDEPFELLGEKYHKIIIKSRKKRQRS